MFSYRLIVFLGVSFPFFLFSLAVDSFLCYYAFSPASLLPPTSLLFSLLIPFLSFPYSSFPPSLPLSSSFLIYSPFFSSSPCVSFVSFCFLLFCFSFAVLCIFLLVLLIMFPNTFFSLIFISLLIRYFCWLIPISFPYCRFSHSCSASFSVFHTSLLFCLFLIFLFRFSSFLLILYPLYHACASSFLSLLPIWFTLYIIVFSFLFCYITVLPMFWSLNYHPFFSSLKRYLFLCPALPFLSLSFILPFIFYSFLPFSSLNFFYRIFARMSASSFFVVIGFSPTHSFPLVRFPLL